MNKIDKNTPLNDFVYHLDLQKNDTVFISSDLNQLAKYGRQNGQSLNVNKVIENLQSILTNGSIVVPAYTDNVLPGGSFDPKKSKPTTGAFSNKVMRRKDFIRSNDPMHSVFAWGEIQSEVKALKNESTFGKDSIFGLLRKKNCKFIFLDISIQNCFTYVHYVEELLRVPYRKFYTYPIKIESPEGKHIQQLKVYGKKMGVYNWIVHMEDFLFENNYFESYQYGLSQIDIITSDVVHPIIEDTIRSEKSTHKFIWKLYFKNLIRKYILGKKGMI